MQKIEYAETAVFRAVLEDDMPRAKELLGDFMDGELVALYGQASAMIDLIQAEARRRGMRT
jgi:hypothetical protein